MNASLYIAFSVTNELIFAVATIFPLIEERFFIAFIRYMATLSALFAAIYAAQGMRA